MKNPVAALRGSSVRTQVVALAVVAVFLGLLVHNLSTRSASADATMPTSQVMEQTLGVRFTRAAVVADGGLVQVSYVILDSDKASRFQDDQKDLPTLTNSRTGASTHRVALMKQGHSLPVGETFYFVYQNNGTVRAHDLATISAHGLSLTGVPVE